MLLQIVSKNAFMDKQPEQFAVPHRIAIPVFPVRRIVSNILISIDKGATC